MIANDTHPAADLAMFVAIAESGGISAAARRLGASKATVSVALARLEGRLGVQLVQRTTRRMSLTEAGAAALPHARLSVAAAKDAVEAATVARAEPRGTLRVSAPNSFGLLHLAPALGDFAKAHREIQVDLVLDDRVTDLVGGGFDLAIRIGALADTGLVAVRLGTSRHALVAHRDYLKRAGTPRRPAELAQHAALVYSLSSTGNRWAFSRGLGPRGAAGGKRATQTVRVAGPLVANSSLVLHQAVRQGLGIARLPRFIVGADLARGALVEVLPEWHTPEHGIFALTTTRESTPRKTRAFIEFLRERLGETPPWER